MRIDFNGSPLGPQFTTDICLIPQCFLREDGTVISGFVISESGRQISLRNSLSQTHVISRDQIEERSRQKTSAMPEGLAGSLQPKQRAY